jgi:hypothetical protein
MRVSSVTAEPVPRRRRCFAAPAPDELGDPLQDQQHREADRRGSRDVPWMTSAAYSPIQLHRINSARVRSTIVVTRSLRRAVSTATGAASASTARAARWWAENCRSFRSAFTLAREADRLAVWIELAPVYITGR